MTRSSTSYEGCALAKSMYTVCAADKVHGRFCRMKTYEHEEGLTKTLINLEMVTKVQKPTDSWDVIVYFGHEDSAVLGCGGSAEGIEVYQAIQSAMSNEMG